MQQSFLQEKLCDILGKRSIMVLVLNLMGRYPKESLNALDLTVNFALRMMNHHHNVSSCIHHILASLLFQPKLRVHFCAPFFHLVHP